MDYESGIEAMILAILQQTTYSQTIELAELTDVVLQTTQDDIVANGLLLTAYANYLTAALAETADVTSIIETSLINMTSTSILPVSDDLMTLQELYRSVSFNSRCCDAETADGGQCVHHCFARHSG